jgi:hypothetical protein
MRQFRLRLIMALVAVIALSIWVGMQIERARSGPRPVSKPYVLMRPVRQVTSGKSYVLMRPVRQTSYQTRP